VKWFFRATTLTRDKQHQSVAFFGGDAVEHSIAERRLGDLERHIAGAHLQSLRFNFFSNFSIKQTPDLIAFSLRMLYAVSDFVCHATVTETRVK
jgi:hypothetical protein